MQRICNSLNNAGFEVKLIGRKLKSSQPIEKLPFESKRIKCIFNSGFLFYAEYNLRLFFYLLFQPFDIVCSIDLDTILPGVLIAKLRLKKCVYDAHEYFTEVPELENRKLTKSIWEKIAKFTIPKTDKRYTVSNSIAEIFNKKYNVDFKTIMNLPLLNENKKQLTQKNHPTIIYQGAINKGRGLEQLIEAMTYLDVKLIIAGEGNLSEHIRMLVKNRNIEEKVEFKGYINQQELEKLTKTATIGYNLLEKYSLSYYYSLGNKFFSYIHAEIPSISSNFPEYNSFNNKFEVSYLTDLKVKSIIKAVNYLIDNKEKYKQLKTNCSKAKEIFNWQKESLKLIKIYNEF